MTATPAPEGAESITEDELTAALVHVEHPCGTRETCESCRGKAISLLGHVMSHREPGYEPGQMYQDADGKNWLYLPERNYARAGSQADCPWLKPGDAAAYSLNSPKRPLRKLVPLPSHGDLVAVLIESITHDVSGYEGQAQRVLRLLEGGSDD